MRITVWKKLKIFDLFIKLYSLYKTIVPFFKNVDFKVIALYGIKFYNPFIWSNKLIQ